jgi:iron complex outermembrane receptor protein
MKKILITLFVGFSALLNAQNKISGTITDKENQPIKGVSVFVSDLHKSSSTDEKGNFTINNLPLGNIKIAFSALGFINQNKTNTVQIAEYLVANKLV